MRVNRAGAGRWVWDWDQSKIPPHALAEFRVGIGGLIGQNHRHEIVVLLVQAELKDGFPAAVVVADAVL